MVSALYSGASAPGSSPGRGHCVVFFCQDTSLSRDGLASHPGRGGGGGEEIFLVASCYLNRSKLRPYEPPAGSYADFTFLPTFFQMVGE